MSRVHRIARQKVVSSIVRPSLSLFFAYCTYKFVTILDVSRVTDGSGVVTAVLMLVTLCFGKVAICASIVCKGSIEIPRLAVTAGPEV